MFKPVSKTSILKPIYHPPHYTTEANILPRQTRQQARIRSGQDYRSAVVVAMAMTMATTWDLGQSDHLTHLTVIVTSACLVVSCFVRMLMVPLLSHHDY